LESGRGPTDCGKLGFYSEVQSGPAPIINWETKETGAAPMEKFYATFITYSANGGASSFCSYGIDRVPARAPNTIKASGLRGAKRPGQFASLVKELTPSWQTVIPNPSAEANFKLTTGFESGGVSKDNPVVIPDQGDPASTRHLPRQVSNREQRSEECLT
jgi:hypothetical protein